MVRIILATLVALVLALPARAQNSDVVGVITSQIEAFQNDDFETAFTYASPFIQGVFRTPEQFGQMVRRGYPMVWRPADVQFLEQRNTDGFIYQKVLFKDAAGGLTVLEYEMLKVGETWQINGVQRLQDPPIAA